MGTLKNEVIMIGMAAFLGLTLTFLNSPQAVAQGKSESAKTVVLTEHSYQVNSTDSTANPSLNQLDVFGVRTIRINFKVGNCPAAARLGST